MELIAIKKLTPLKFLMRTSHTISKIQYKPQDDRTFTLFYEQLKHLLSGCRSTENFAKLTSFSSVLTAAVT